MKFRSPYLPILPLSFALAVTNSFAADDSAKPIVSTSESQSANRAVRKATTATFSVNATGSSTLLYQWYKGPASNVSDATNSTLIIATAANAETHSVVAEAIVPTGRMELFNGKDFAGWTFFMRNNANPTDTWSVADGLIKCTGKPTGYLRTTQDYRDYKLTTEWRFVKIAPKADNGGILVHMQLPDKLWPPCIQCQGKHDAVGDLFLMGGAESKEHLGKDANTALPKQGESAEKPVGEWNTCELVCSGNSVKAYVNGKLMNETTESTVTSGKIGFQCEGAEFEVRKVFIEPLKP